LFLWIVRSSLSPIDRPPQPSALAAQILLGLYLLAVQADVNWVYWYADGGGRAKSALYGIWTSNNFPLTTRRKRPT